MIHAIRAPWRRRTVAALAALVLMLDVIWGDGGCKAASLDVADHVSVVHIPGTDA